MSKLKNFLRTKVGTLVAVLLIIVALAVVGKAYAADTGVKSIGGDCCADLEERIAELEATAAKKGNRKVSLAISGWVAEQVMWWDDGAETNVYVGGLGRTLASHMRLSGEALINPDLSAGFVMHIEVVSGDSLLWNQDDPSGGGTAVEAFQTYWFLKSKSLGKVSVGKQYTASDNAALLVDSSGSMVPANWVLFDNASFFLRDKDGALLDATWGDLGYCNWSSAGLGGDCTAAPRQAIRYDTPTWQGFSASAAWGADDFWDVALRYAGEMGGFKVAGTAAFARTSDTLDIAPGADHVDYAQAGVYLEHVATGLFAYGAYGQERDGLQGNDGKRWYGKVGARERWTKLGHTVLYAEYGQANDMFNGAALDESEAAYTGGCWGWLGCHGTETTQTSTVTSSELRHFGLGVVQEIDAAAMSLWISWRHYEGKVSGVESTSCVDWGFASCGAGVPDAAFGGSTQDFDLIKAGALINF